jgi:hypothetical protein
MMMMIIIIIIINLHYSALDIETTDKWYVYKPKPICEHEDVLWNQGVHTDREVTANRPDIKKKKKKKNILIDVAIPAARNVGKMKQERN